LHAFKCLEWIPFEKFENVTYLTRGGFSKIYSADWPEGNLEYWDIDNREWERCSDVKVALKSLDNSSNISKDFLNEVIKIIISLSYMLLYTLVKNKISYI
jgi:hypothetical protein